MIRAKFVVSQTEDGADGTKNITLSAVTASRGNEENRLFSDWIPVGKITLSCLNPEANSQFENGAEFYVDFSRS